MLDTPLVTTARSIKVALKRLGANGLIGLGQSFYHSIVLRDTGKNFIRKRLNDEIYKFVPALAVSADTYEPDVLSWLREWLQPGDTFWDIGANLGWTSLPAARIVGSSGRIIAVEASPANAALLKRHIGLNECENIVTVIESAVCERHGGSVTFSLLNDGFSPCNSLMFSESVNGGVPEISQQVTVPAISLDSLLAEQAHGRAPKLVKIDVEGAELKVLKGGIKLLSSESAPILLLAVHPFWQASPEDCQEIVNLLKSWGYQILNRQGSGVEELEYDEYLCLPPSL